jgi:hemin uptake protein HemP
MTDDPHRLDTRSETADASQASPEEMRPLIIRSEDLLQGRREIWIAHGDDMYRLRLTSSGRLYLTK